MHNPKSEILGCDNLPHLIGISSRDSERLGRKIKLLFKSSYLFDLRLMRYETWIKDSQMMTTKIKIGLLCASSWEILQTWWCWQLTLPLLTRALLDSENFQIILLLGQFWVLSSRGHTLKQHTKQHTKQDKHASQHWLYTSFFVAMVGILKSWL